MSQKESCRENQITNVMSSILFPPKIVPFVRQCGKNMVESCRPQKALWRMRIAFLLTNATDTHSECLRLNVFCTATIVTWTRPDVRCMRTLPVSLVMHYLLIRQQKTAKTAGTRSPLGCSDLWSQLTGYREQCTLCGTVDVIHYILN